RLWVSSTVAVTPKSASIRTRSRFSMSSALSPRMRAPTSVSATRLMRDQRVSFLSISLPCVMPKLTPLLAQPQSSSPDPFAGKAQQAQAEEPEPVARGAPGGGAPRSRSVRREHYWPGKELVRVLLHCHGAAAAGG